MYLYFFIDEGGNFDFSPSGTKYFTLSCLSKWRPFHACKDLISLKYDLIEKGMDLEYFHASDDKQATRDQVFEIIEKHLYDVQLDTLVVEKRKTNPSIRPEDKFYPKMFIYLLDYAIGHYKLEDITELIIFTDSIPNKKKRKAIEKAIKMALAKKYKGKFRYRIYHHTSKSNFDLQIVDYMNWAVYRKWDSGDERSYSKIKSIIKSEFDIFGRGDKVYY